jgi:transcriptional regulator with XRE-family HTH domain
MNKAEQMEAGRRLREIRESLGLTLKDVEERSRRIVEIQQDSYYLITAGRLSQLENSSSLPGLYKLATLGFIYKLSLSELFEIYGVEIPDARAEEKPAQRATPSSLPDGQALT